MSWGADIAHVPAEVLGRMHVVDSRAVVAVDVAVVIVRPGARTHRARSQALTSASLRRGAAI